MAEKFGVYKIEATGAQEAGKTAYILRGPRGAKYYLVRAISDPSMMFAVNRKMDLISIHGYNYFTDKSGELRGHKD